MSIPAHILAQKLQQILLLGLNRMEMDIKVRNALEALGIDPSLSAEEQLLTGIAILSQWEKTGQPFPKVSNQDLVLLPEETLLPAPLSIEPFFQATLSGNFRAVLPEVLFLLHTCNFSLPLHWVPNALEKTLDDPSLWPYLYPVLGQRGIWMTEQLPHWRLFAEKHPPTGKTPDDPISARRQILQALAGESGYVYPRNAEDIAAPPEKLWNESFALQILEYIALRTTLFSPASDEGPATLLLVCAQSCPRDLFYRFSSYSWPQEGLFWMKWQPLVRKFIAIVEFRQSLYNTLLIP